MKDFVLVIIFLHIIAAVLEITNCYIRAMLFLDPVSIIHYFFQTCFTKTFVGKAEPAASEYQTKWTKPYMVHASITSLGCVCCIYCDCIKYVHKPSRDYFWIVSRLYH